MQLFFYHLPTKVPPDTIQLSLTATGIRKKDTKYSTKKKKKKIQWLKVNWKIRQRGLNQCNSSSQRTIIPFSHSQLPLKMLNHRIPNNFGSFSSSHLQSRYIIGKLPTLQCNLLAKGCPTSKGHPTPTNVLFARLILSPETTSKHLRILFSNATSSKTAELKRMVSTNQSQMVLEVIGSFAMVMPLSCIIPFALGTWIYNK